MQHDRAETASSPFPPLEHLTQPGVSTNAAAHYLDRKPQTLRAWACLENGPIRPLRINGRLLWPTAELRKLVGLEAKVAV